MLLEVPFPVLDLPPVTPPLEAAPPLAAPLFLVAVLAEASPRLEEVFLEAEDPLLRIAEEPPLLAELPLLVVERPVDALLLEAEEPPLEAEDLEIPLDVPPLEALFAAPPLAALFELPPLEAAPLLAATAFLADLLAEARPRLVELPLLTVERPPAALLEAEEPPLEAEDLEAPLEEPLLDAPPLEALFAAPPLEALFEPPPLEAAPPLAATAFLVDLLAEARPRLEELLLDAELRPPDALLEAEEPPLEAEDLEAPLEEPLLDADDPPRDADEPPRLAEDFDAPPLREEELPLLATLFLVALLADARPLEEDPLEAPPLLAVLRPPEELFEALLEALPREALLLEADDPLLEEEEEPLLEEEPLRLEDELLLAAFLGAALEEELPPALLLPAFLAAAFLVDVAIFNGFCVRVNKICVLKLQRCK
ncbi:MAG TPA: hypothetical protein VGE66_20540 [Chitinophagaceae bacterium]